KSLWPMTWILGMNEIFSELSTPADINGPAFSPVSIMTPVLGRLSQSAQKRASLMAPLSASSKLLARKLWNSARGTRRSVGLSSRHVGEECRANESAYQVSCT